MQSVTIRTETYKTTLAILTLVLTPSFYIRTFVNIYKNMIRWTSLKKWNSNNYVHKCISFQILIQMQTTHIYPATVWFWGSNKLQLFSHESNKGSIDSDSCSATEKKTVTYKNDYFSYLQTTWRLFLDFVTLQNRHNIQNVRTLSLNITLICTPC